MKVVPYYPRRTVPLRPTEASSKAQKSGASVEGCPVKVVQRYPRRSVAVKNYTEEVPHDDHYICKQCRSVAGTPPHPRFGGLIRGAQIGEILITISVVFIGYRNREIPDTLVMF